MGCDHMTKKETIELMAILKAAYPNSYNGMTEQEAIGVVTVWHLHFADVPADIVFMALQKAISANKFPPSINEVKTKLEAVYWEASELLGSYNIELPPEVEKEYRRICDSIGAYKFARSMEPSVQQLLFAMPHASQSLAEGPARIGGA